MRQTSCIGGGTTEMAANVVAERVLGMPSERTHGPRRHLPGRAAGSGRPQLNFWSIR